MSREAYRDVMPREVSDIEAIGLLPSDRTRVEEEWPETEG